MIDGKSFSKFKHPRQRPRAILASLFSLLLFPVIAVLIVAGTVGLIVPLIVLILWIATRVAFTNVMGNSVLVSELNYPRIFALSEEVKAQLNYDKPIHIFVYQQGEFNAFMRKFFFRRAVFLNSEMVEKGVTDDELRWVIGRFVGYWRARRRSGLMGGIIRLAQRFIIFNFFILPYERAMVYTGDRLALGVINGDIGTAVSAMQKLFVGRALGYSVNPAGIIQQHRRVKGSIFAFFARLYTMFPHQTARYVDLIAFAQRMYPEQYAKFNAENPGLPSDLQHLSS
ncbi:MAG: M48 family metallopeptidase [Pseudomonadota bacterium]